MLELEWRWWIFRSFRSSSYSAGAWLSTLEKKQYLSEKKSECRCKYWKTMVLYHLHSCMSEKLYIFYVPVNSKTAHAPPPPGQTPGHLTFLKNFGQIPRYVASLYGQIPHPLELQRGSNPLPSRLDQANCGNKFFKIFNQCEFLVQLVFAPHFKQRHIPRYNFKI